MRTREKINSEITRMLVELRRKNGLTKSKIADILEIDRHTWFRWESGESTPGITDFIMIFDKLNEPVLQPLLDILYPSDDDALCGSMTQIRKAAAIYYLTQANEHEMRIWDYVISTDFSTQVEALCALHHLPPQQRFLINEQIYIYYMLGRRHAELVNTDSVMPDMDIFSKGLKQSQKSAYELLRKE